MHHEDEFKQTYVQKKLRTKHATTQYSCVFIILRSTVYDMANELFAYVLEAACMYS